MTQVGDQFFGVLFKHHALAFQILHRGDARVDVADEDERRMLEDRRQGNHRLAFGAFKQQGAGADAEIGTAARNLVDDVEVGRGLAQLDLQPLIAVVALFQRSVVAGKLELVAPLELQRYVLVGRGERNRRQKHETGTEQDVRRLAARTHQGAAGVPLLADCSHDLGAMKFAKAAERPFQYESFLRNATRIVILR